MFYLGLMISVLTPLTFAQVSSIEGCYLPFCDLILPNKTYSLYNALSSNCTDNVRLINYWWYRARNSGIQLNANPKWIRYINNTLPTVWLLPGLGEEFEYASTGQIKDAYFDNGGITQNIIEIDYRVGLSSPALYMAAEGSCNYLDVAVKIARYISFLNTSYHFQIEKMHIIGVSFGAHLSGIVGNLVRMNSSYSLARITGLDPLGLGYYCVTCKSLWLKKGDAKFVDTIHTNPGRIGEALPLGDIDFYVNFPYSSFSKSNFTSTPKLTISQVSGSASANGSAFFSFPSYTQPGCENSSTPDTCSSLRSATLYAESVINNTFRATSCPPLASALMCPVNDKTYMGLYAEPSKFNIYYVKTNSKPPYGKGPPGKIPKNKRNKLFGIL